MNKTLWQFHITSKVPKQTEKWLTRPTKISSWLTNSMYLSSLRKSAKSGRYFQDFNPRITTDAQNEGIERRIKHNLILNLKLPAMEKWVFWTKHAQEKRSIHFESLVEASSIHKTEAQSKLQRAMLEEKGWTKAVCKAAKLPLWNKNRKSTVGIDFLNLDKRASVYLSIFSTKYILR